MDDDVSVLGGVFAVTLLGGLVSHFIWALGLVCDTSNPETSLSVPAIVFTIFITTIMYLVSIGATSLIAGVLSLGYKPAFFAIFSIAFICENIFLWINFPTQIQM